MATTGALPAIQSGASLDPEYQKEYFDALKQSLESLQKRQEPNLLNVAGAFLNPGRTGSFGEALGNAASVMGKQQEEQEARAPQIAQMRAALAGQKFQVEQEARGMGMLAQATGEGNVGQSVSGEAMAGNMNPAKMQKLMAITPFLTGKPLEMAKTIFGQNKELFDLMIKQGELKNNQNRTGMEGQRLEYEIGTPNAKPLTTDEKAVVTTESGGNPNAVSPKGAIGLWQVMPPTNLNPGFGVKPAQNDSPEERDRVGRDYWNAMKDKYGGNTALAAVAYNAGPGFADKWIAEGGDPRQLPDETRKYVTDVVTRAAINSLPSQQTSTPASVGTGGTSNLPPKIQNEIKIKQAESDIAATRADREARAKPYNTQHDTIAAYDANTVQMNDLRTRELINLVNNNKDVVGQLVHQGPMTALLQLAETGVSTPWGSVSAPVTEAINKLNLTSGQQAVARNIAQLIYTLNQDVMKAGKSIYGPQISTFDAQQMAKPGFKETDPASFIMYLGSKNIVTNKYMGEMAEKQAEYFEKNPNASTSSFFRSPEYKDVVKRFHTTYADLVNNHSPYSGKE